MLAIIDSKKFNYKNKIGEFKYIELKTWLIILEIIQLVKYLLKKDLNTLNEIKHEEMIKREGTPLNRRNY